MAASFSTRSNATLSLIRSVVAVVVLTVAVVAVMGTRSSADSSQSILGSLYGSLPNVTIDGVPSARLPWSVDGQVSFEAGRLRASGTVVVAAGYTASGTPVRRTVVGSTDGLRSVTVEVRDATGGRYVTSAVPLSASGSFEIKTPVNLPGPIADPVVLLGTPGPQGMLTTWIASSDFLSDFGYQPPVIVPPPSPGGGLTSLEAVGTPSTPYCLSGTYSTTSAFGGSRTLTIAGVSYPDGFQLSGNGSGGIYIWHIGGQFRTFTALVGLDKTDTLQATLSFPSVVPGNFPNEPISHTRAFLAGSAPVTQLTISAGLPTLISLNVTGVQDLIIYSSTEAKLDFVNDRFQ
jgi:hypothetical protein